MIGQETIQSPPWLKLRPITEYAESLTRYHEFLARKRASLARRVFIYALIDPFTDDVRYVGKSIRPKERLTNHCNEQTRTWRTNWIQSVLARGKRPRLRLLEVLDCDDDWQAAERRWIAGLRAQGANLTNCTSGGDGVPDLPPEIRARMRQVWIGRKHSAETRAKIGRASRGRKHTDVWREHMRTLMRGRTIAWNETVRHAVEKLTAEQVREIRAALASHVSQYVLAERYGVHQGTISNIKRGLCYQWVE
jgi:hypothetical protein